MVFQEVEVGLENVAQAIFRQRIPSIGYMLDSIEGN